MREQGVVKGPLRRTERGVKSLIFRYSTAAFR